MNEEQQQQWEEDYICKRLIYTCLLLEEYSYRELLSSPLVVGKDRYNVSTKLRYIKNQLLQLARDSRATKEMVEKSEDLALNNVGLMASIMGTLALLPECQVDYIEEEFGKMCLQAMENFKNK